MKGEWTIAEISIVVHRLPRGEMPPLPEGVGRSWWWRIPDGDWMDGLLRCDGLTLGEYVRAVAGGVGISVVHREDEAEDV